MEKILTDPALFSNEDLQTELTLRKKNLKIQYLE